MMLSFLTITLAFWKALDIIVWALRHLIWIVDSERIDPDA